MSITAPRKANVDEISLMDAWRINQTEEYFTSDRTLRVYVVSSFADCRRSLTGQNTSAAPMCKAIGSSSVHSFNIR